MTQGLDLNSLDLPVRNFSFPEPGWEAYAPFAQVEVAIGMLKTKEGALTGVPKMRFNQFLLEAHAQVGNHLLGLLHRDFPFKILKTEAERAVSLLVSGSMAYLKDCTTPATARACEEGKVLDETLRKMKDVQFDSLPRLEGPGVLRCETLEASRVTARFLANGVEGVGQVAAVSLRFLGEQVERAVTALCNTTPEVKRACQKTADLASEVLSEAEDFLREAR